MTPSAENGMAFLDDAAERLPSDWKSALAPETDGARVLDDTRAFIARFCVFPDQHCLSAVALWAAHAHMVEHFYTTPRLALLSPEPASGKTRVLEVLDLLAPEAMLTLNASPAAIFRTLEQGPVTLLFDEIDTIFSKRGKDENHEDLRGLLNAGYKRGARIPRCVGSKFEVVHFPVFCAVALAGLGSLPDTIMSRSVIIRMRRRAPGERVEEFRTRKHASEGHQLRGRLASWGESVGIAAGDAWPELPTGIVDRPAEIWEPLIAVADAAGGHWPETARKACEALCRVAEDRSVSLGIRLLSDLQRIWGDAEALYTETILQRLCDGGGLDADAPWAELRGKRLGVRGLATMLGDYGVKSRKVREPGKSPLQGYRRADLWDAWRRYLPLPVTGYEEHAEHAEQMSNGLASRCSGRVPDVPEMADDAVSPEHQNRRCARIVPSVPEVPHMRPLESDSADHDEEII